MQPRQNWLAAPALAMHAAVALCFSTSARAPRPCECWRIRGGSSRASPAWLQGGKRHIGGQSSGQSCYAAKGSATRRTHPQNAASLQIMRPGSRRSTNPNALARRPAAPAALHLGAARWRLYRGTGSRAACGRCQSRGARAPPGRSRAGSGRRSCGPLAGWWALCLMGRSPAAGGRG